MILKYSLKKITTDNITCIFIAFNNFEEAFKSEDFEFKSHNMSNITDMKEEVDLGLVLRDKDNEVSNNKNSVFKATNGFNNYNTLSNRKPIINTEDPNKPSNKRYFLLKPTNLK